MPFTLPQVETLPIMEHVDEARKFYEAYGVVIVRILDESRCDDLIIEQWTNIIQSQPWTEAYKVHAPHDPHTDRRAFLNFIKSPLSAKTRKEFKEGWCLHRGFGACCDPVVFHLPGVWQVRQDPKLYDVARALTNENKLWVTLERSIQKLPGEGENEFLHWDLDPMNIEDVDSKSTHVCGKVCYTQSRFVCVPGTHTPHFFAEFKDKYGPYYYNIRDGTPKFAIDFSKPDPLNLVAHERAYVVPAGCVVMWNDRLLHGQIKTQLTDPIEFGCYVGFRAARPNEKYKKVCGIDELHDRLKSYNEGVAPQLWPSLDRIQFYPKRFQNFPKLLQAYIDKMPPTHPSITERLTGNKRKVPHLVPWRDHTYTPPQLTNHGRKLLGLDQWDSSSSSSSSSDDDDHDDDNDDDDDEHEHDEKKIKVKEEVEVKVKVKEEKEVRDHNHKAKNKSTDVPKSKMQIVTDPNNMVSWVCVWHSDVMNE